MRGDRSGWLPPLVRRGEGVLGVSTIERHLAAGRLQSVLPGVYLRPDAMTDPQWRAAAVAAWRPEAVLTTGIAAALTFWREAPTDRIDVAYKSTLSRPGFTFTRRVIPEELVIHHGQARLTHPALTALDLAVPTDGVAIDHLLRSRMARIGDLEHVLAATPHRRGNRDRRRYLLDSRSEPWSIAERRAHRLLRTSGITGWQANVPVTIGGARYFLDIAFSDIRLVVEIDGIQFHSGRAVFESDRHRQNALVLAGWTVLRFTYHQVMDEPAAVVERVRDGIRVARHRGRAPHMRRRGADAAGAEPPTAL